MKKIFILLIFILFVINFENKVEASSLLFKSSNINPSLGEQFYVDLLIDVDGKSINGIQSSLSFDNNHLKLIRVEDSKSMVNLWVEKPREEFGIINFSGLMTNGFDGVIDPFDTTYRLPGHILKLIFEPVLSGETDIKINDSSLTINDGFGTFVKASSTNLNIKISEFIKKVSIESEHSIPNIEYFVVEDDNLYDGKNVIIFEVKDEGSGIREVLIKEGYRKWKNAESPYLIKNQNMTSTIKIKAINLMGEYFEVSIEPMNSKNYLTVILFISIILVIFIVIYRKIYGNKK
jgi:hypothetical protein